MRWYVRVWILENIKRERHPLPTESNCASDRHGQLGDGTETDRSTPVEVIDLRVPIMPWIGEEQALVAGGYSHSLAVLQDGTVAAWGSNGQGQLGIGIDTWTPQPVVWAPLESE